MHAIFPLFGAKALYLRGASMRKSEANKKAYFFESLLQGLLGFNTISVTADSMSKIPSASRIEKDSLKTNMPINTAVKGSSAPIIEVGVEPIALAA